MREKFLTAQQHMKHHFMRQYFYRKVSNVTNKMDNIKLRLFCHNKTVITVKTNLVNEVSDVLACHNVVYLVIARVCDA